MKLVRRSWKYLILTILLVIVCLAGCKMAKDNGKKVRDLDFSVIGETDEPEELRNIILEKKELPFKLTYTDDQNLFIVVGYGKQETGGYSIAVDDLYLTENSIIFDTELLGPEKGTTPGPEPSFPYIVVKTELLENPVVFQ